MELAKNLQQALDSHRRQLVKHLKIWKKVQTQHAQDLEIASTAESCQKRTERMIEQCSSIDFHKIVNGNGTSSSKKQKRSIDVEDAPVLKKARRLSEDVDDAPTDESATMEGHRVPVTKDPSGLFLIDSNPDVNLVNRLSDGSAKRHGKHKRNHESDSEEEDIDVPPEVESLHQEESTPKRKKVKHAAPVPDPPDEQEKYAEDIGKKVVLRLKEKDEAGKKKANKKRKRESDVSVEERQDDVGDRVKPPPSKKPKGKASATTPAARPSATTAKPGTTQAEKGIKSRKRMRPSLNERKKKKKKDKTSG